jgi:5'-nucleotidase
MPVDLSKTLVVAISSSALFDMRKADAIYRAEGLDQYSQHQLEFANVPLAPGTGFPLIRAVLRLNEITKHLPEATRKAEVVVVSKNSPATSMRLYNSIKHHGLTDIQRSVLSGGSPIAKYLRAFNVDLFLSNCNEDVEEALSFGIPAAMLYAAPENKDEELEQIRIAFDGDAVLFSGESEAIYKEHGLDHFVKHESDKAEIPLPEGPFANLLKVLSFLQQDPHFQDKPPERIALVTARSMPTHERVIRTLNGWNVRVDEAFFMGGVAKTDILNEFRPHIFFDDQDVHCMPASRLVPVGRVPATYIEKLPQLLSSGTDAEKDEQ